jgi:dipeptidyl aminopeptidase/acylaminoacyl peptidase
MNGTDARDPGACGLRADPRSVGMFAMHDELTGTAPRESAARLRSGENMKRSLVALALVAAAASPSAAQTVSYTKAEQLLNWNTSRLVSGDSVRPQWMHDGNRFWYRNKTANGHEYVVVDPVRNTKGMLFDNTRLAAAMSMAKDTSYDPSRLPFNRFEFADDGKDERRIEFRASKKDFTCDIVAYSCTVRDTSKSEVPYVTSPDKKWDAFVVKHNVWIRPHGGGGDSTQLTTDGVPYWSYGLNLPRPSELQRPRPRRPQIRWSPDSRKIAVSRMDERGVGLMPYISATFQRPKYYTQPYALPGDSIVPLPTVHIIDITTKANVLAHVAPRPNQLSMGSARDSAWSERSDRLYVSYFTRGSKSAYLGAVDPNTGALSVVARDTGKTFVEISPPTDPSTWYVTHDGKDAFWWSERDGWGHLYRYDATGQSAVASDGDGGSTPVRTGIVKNQITSGPWNVGQIEYVDETAKQVYFTARGREPGQFWYYPKLYRVGYDGSGLTLLTPEDAYHDIEFSPSGKYIVDTYERIEQSPVTVLRSAADGRVIRELEKADISRLKAAGWRAAQTFTVKARDGVTDLYGVIYMPPNIDPSKKYPIITHIYPGPQVGSVGTWTFKDGGEDFSLAELGFVVIQLDHLGTPGRSKAFHDNYYGNFGDNGLPDHIAAIRQLAARYPFIDLDRVGIFGHSGGGFASTDAMLRYPEFFKVAVSGSGNHDNRSYNIYWAEKYQGLMQRDTLRKTDNFAASANKGMAKNLRGHLLLMHGDMDDNVHPAMTIQVIDELIKANKTFDLIIAPNRNHGLNEPYFIRRRWDYFVEYLLGGTPPDNYEIVRPADLGDNSGVGPVAGDPDPDIPDPVR